MLYPGGTCARRLSNSGPVPQTFSSRIKPLGQLPDVSLSNNVTIIPPKEFHTGDFSYAAKSKSEKPDVSLSTKVEIIPPKEFSTADYHDDIDSKHSTNEAADSELVVQVDM